MKKHKVSYKEVSKYPEVRRDLALLIDNEVTFEILEKIAVDTERNILKSVNLFDVYEGENIEKGKKSYALSFVLLDETKTLTDKIIDKTMQKIIKAFEMKVNAKLR
jgi:phenylalanyl-tRNA synthetase beta chain